MKDTRFTGSDEHINQRLARNFIEKIESDRDQALDDIASKTHGKIARIHQQAYRAAREFHRLSAEQTRHRCRRESDLHSARAAARLRRESWRALRRLQQTALMRARSRLNELYGAPGAQWAWCRYWLSIAFDESQGQTLQVMLGRGILPETRNRMEDYLRSRNVPCTIGTEETLGNGITIAWGRQLLDGRLEIQIPCLAEEIFKRLAIELHTRLEEDGDEPR